MKVFAELVNTTEGWITLAVLAVTVGLIAFKAIWFARKMRSPRPPTDTRPR